METARGRWNVGALVPAFAFVTLALEARTQGYGDGSDGALAPTANVTLDTTANGGVFQFTSIVVPAGVTVRVVGPNPARMLCQGAVQIDGGIDCDGEGSLWASGSVVNASGGGPGGHAGGGGGQPGGGPGGGGAGIGIYPAIHGGSASHATVGVTSNPFVQPAPTYGSAFPFELQGGSGGGGPGGGTMSSYGPPASGGGGAIAILAGGAVVVTGTVRARGGDVLLGPEFWPGRPGTGGSGSGGAILLRSLQWVRVAGSIDARGGLGGVLPNVSQYGGDGFVRIDGYSAYGSPNLAGAIVRPLPFVATLPYLELLEEAHVGRTARIRVASAPGDVFGIYYSLGTGSLPTPFGVLELDTSLILFLGQFAVPTSGDDPLAAADVAVPNLLELVGVTFHAQAFNAFGTVTGLPRFSNRLPVTIGP